jgi:hypothetical protein
MSRCVLIVYIVLFYFFIFLTFRSCVVCNKYLDLKFEQVMAGHEEWCDTNTCVNTSIQAVRQEIENSQKLLSMLMQRLMTSSSFMRRKGQGHTSC